MTNESPVIVFDGVCLLCSRWVRFILTHDRQARFRLASMQSERGRHLLLGNGLDPDDPTSFLLLEGEQAYTDTDALIRILPQLGATRWRLLAACIRLTPRFIRDSAYRFVARHRYRLFGRSDTCLVPEPAQAHRFID
jgi:predicted DCC family thiol-disulfide oxidoreductase YuxK